MSNILGRFLGKAPVPLLGIDIGESSIKLVQLGRSGSGYRLEAFAVEPMPEDTFSDGNIVAPARVAAAIKRALKQSRGKTRDCAVAVSGWAVITNVVNVHADLTEDDIEAQFEVEAGQYIPYPREEVSLDFAVLGPAPRSPVVLEVLLSATKTEHVDTLREIAGLVDLNLQIGRAHV